MDNLVAVAEDRRCKFQESEAARVVAEEEEIKAAEIVVDLIPTVVGLFLAAAQVAEDVVEVADENFFAQQFRHGAYRGDDCHHGAFYFGGGICVFDED